MPTVEHDGCIPRYLRDTIIRLVSIVNTKSSTEPCLFGLTIDRWLVPLIRGGVKMPPPADRHREAGEWEPLRRGTCGCISEDYGMWGTVAYFGEYGTCHTKLLENSKGKILQREEVGRITVSWKKWEKGGNIDFMWISKKKKFFLVFF